jgi:hypothetical protein
MQVLYERQQVRMYPKIQEKPGKKVSFLEALIYSYCGPKRRVIVLFYA